MKTFLQSRCKVMAKLSSGKVALSTDLWSSPNKLAFMGITVATLDTDFIPIDVVIGFKHMIGEHSGTKIAKHFYETIEIYNIQDRVS